MDIGRRLRIAREAIGYTLRKVSEESGIGESSISEFENSKREPKFSQLSRLAEVYKRAVEFFLSEEPLIEDVMLWREKPDKDEERRETEATFRQLCRQYRRLEVLTGEKEARHLPTVSISCEDFGYRDAKKLAEEFQKNLLGDIPSASLKQILEEKFYIKIFHLQFCGSAISISSDEFGPAILLSKDSKLWRRNFDLAHELFHLLTWNIFRHTDSENDEPSDREEKLASAFASRLLLPTDAVKDKIEAATNEKGHITLEALDEIAREFGVSLQALLWRMLYLYNKPAEKVEEYVEQARTFRTDRPPRRSDEPDELPERYCSLAIRALKEGRLSLMQFAKYMGISYKKAQDYVTEDEDFEDEKVSISLA